MLGATADVFLLLFIAVLVSLYLGAVADVVHHRSGLPRRVALLLSVLATLAAVVGLFWLLVPPVVEQTQGLLRVLPGMVLNWERGIDGAINRMPALRAVFPPGEHRVLLAVYDQVAGYVSEIFPKLVSILHVAIEFLSVAIMSLYLAMYPGIYRERLIALFPPVHRDLARDVLADLANTLRSWIVGQLLAMFVLAALTTLGLYLLRVPYWLAFGVFTGVVAIVPFFGTLVSTVLPALFVLGGDSGLTHALLVAGLGVVIHVFEGNVVAPLIMHRQVNLPPVMTIMSVLIMGKLLGPVGLLVAVPTVAVLDVVIRRILINRVYEGRGFRRLVRDSALVVRVPAMDGDVILPDSDTDDILALVESRQPATRSTVADT
jgi:predicted PurR-regulated permease PerM